jgi:DNA-nicking Smr family endonuclease
MTGRRRREDDDELVWWWATREVAPLPGKTPPPAPAAGAIPPKPIAAPEESVDARSRRGPAAAPVTPDLAPGRAPGLDRRTLQRLGRGILPIAAEIDLHGLSQTRARDALAAFLGRCRSSERACVRVITGHGRRGAEGTGVLRDAVPRWLNEPDLRGLVLGFAVAQPHHGGHGAFYVLLRKRG